MWAALGLPGPVAGERLAAAGRALAGALLDQAAEEVVAGLLEGLSPRDTAEVVLCADGEALALPVELVRLRTAGGGEAGPLGLLPAVAVSRRPQPGAVRRCAGRRGRRGGAAGLAGPLKVLAAVAAPEETKTASPPLDAEAEMAAVLDAVAEDRRWRPRRCGSGGRLAGRDPAGAGARRLPRAAPVRARVGRRRWSWRTRTGTRSR